MRRGEAEANGERKTACRSEDEKLRERDTTSSLLPSFFLSFFPSHPPAFLSSFSYPLPWSRRRSASSTSTVPKRSNPTRDEASTNTISKDTREKRKQRRGEERKGKEDKEME